MRCFLINIVVGLSLHALAPVDGAQASMHVTPIEKVLQMMGEMLSKGKKEKNEEEVEFAKFQAFCEDVISDTTKDIAEAAKKIEQLTADIAKAESDAKKLGEEVDELEGDVAQWEGELK